MTIFCYCYASGEAHFGGSVPKGAIIIDRLTKEAAAIERNRMALEEKLYEQDPVKNPYPKQGWRQSLEAKFRLAYDNETLLVPGIPEAENQEEALEALQKFRKWAVKQVS